MRKIVIPLCLALLFAPLVCAEHLVYGQVEVDGEEFADGARVTLTNERTGGRCRATVGDEQSGWWSVDVDECMSEWASGDNVIVSAKKGSLTAEDSMTLSSGGSQQAPSLTLEEPEASSGTDETRLFFFVYPAGSRFGSESGPYCEHNPLTFRFYKKVCIREKTIHNPHAIKWVKCCNKIISRFFYCF